MSETPSTHHLAPFLPSAPTTVPEQRGPVHEDDGASWPPAAVPAHLGPVLTDLLTGTHDAVVVEDARRRILWVNRALVDLLAPGSGPADLIGADCDDAAQAASQAFAHPGDFLAEVELLQAERLPEHGVPVTLADGRVVQRSFVPLRHEDGSDAGTIWLYGGAGSPADEALSLARRQVAALQEVTDRQRLALVAVTRAQGLFLDHEVEQAWGVLLDALLSLTGADYGFLGEVLHDEDGTLFLRTHGVVDIAWDDATRAFVDEHASTGLEFRGLQTLFGHTLRTGEAVLSADPQQHPSSGGLPPGHPTMRSYAGLPVTRRGELVGMVGLANATAPLAEVPDRTAPLLAVYATLLDLMPMRR